MCLHDCSYDGHGWKYLQVPISRNLHQLPYLHGILQVQAGRSCQGSIFLANLAIFFIKIMQLAKLDLYSIQTGNTLIMLVFMRHAERGDNQFPQIASSLPYDPPLTNLSPATIRKSCTELSQMLKSNGITKIKIVTSKFLRCLMTTEKAAQELKSAGLIIQNQYQIRGQISQFLRKDWFQEYPMHKLVFDKQQIRTYIQKPQSFILKQLPKLQFPQTYLQFHQRVGQFYEQLPTPHPHTAILYITHGFVIRQIIWRMRQVIDIQKQIAYAGWIAYRKGLAVASKL